MEELHLRTRRLALGLNQVELAKIARIPQQTLSRAERGRGGAANFRLLDIVLADLEQKNDN
jgi:transcriptional regulator with XRE-family HTH domain